MGKRLKDLYPHATKWEMFKYKVRKFFRKLFIWSFVIGSIIVVYKVGGIMNPATIYTKAEVIKEVEVSAPIMERIAFCESGGKHWDKNGQVLMRSNSNRSVDIGKFQINTVWFTKATELGLDLTKEKDNEAMALWIYKNRGTGDWSSSSNCWKK